jgi:hypothetical protein
MWYANSPDFNLIEMLCEMIKKIVRVKGRMSLGEFRTSIHETWNSIDQVIIDRLIKSFLSAHLTIVYDHQLGIDD